MSEVGAMGTLGMYWECSERIFMLYDGNICNSMEYISSNITMNAHYF